MNDRKKLLFRAFGYAVAFLTIVNVASALIARKKSRGLAEEYAGLYPSAIKTAREIRVKSAEIDQNAQREKAALKPDSNPYATAEVARSVLEKSGAKLKSFKLLDQDGTTITESIFESSPGFIPTFLGELEKHPDLGIVRITIGAGNDGKLNGVIRLCDR